MENKLDKNIPNEEQLDGIEKHIRQIEQTGIWMDGNALRDNMLKYPTWQDREKRYRETYFPHST